MYTSDFFADHSYFGPILKTRGIVRLLDSLTGILNREHMVEYALHLINSGIPFSLTLLDLDNFKMINDHYGHRSGDAVLVRVAKGLADFIGKDGVVGRFGGDEFLVIHTKIVEYDDIHDLFEQMYESKKFVRTEHKLENCSPYVTSTIGCASFPRDAISYDELFAKVDKALYRGKFKGRNCFIIYVPEKHDHLEITRLAHQDLINAMETLTGRFDHKIAFLDKLQLLYYYFNSAVNAQFMFWLKKNERLIDCSNKTDCGINCQLVKRERSESASFGFYVLAELEKDYPELYSFLGKKNITSLLCVNIKNSAAGYGQLMFGQTGDLRIWQNDEKALFYYLGRLSADYLYNHPDEI